MAGITHGWTTAQPDNPAYDVSQRNLNDHVVVEYFDVTGGAAVPAAPAAGKVRQYIKVTGITPNKNVRIGYLLEDGTDIVLADVTI